MEIKVNLGEHSYPIVISSGALDNIKDYLVLQGKILVASDDQIPQKYIDLFLKNYPNALTIRIPHGEENKSLEIYEKILKFLSDHAFSRKDNIVALGGGLTSDIAGFAASSYMRGIGFYVIPTTLLSQVDASVGGKVAVNFNGYKNIVGAFYQPKKVVIDPNTLETLSNRLLAEGLAEVIKMSLTSNKDLFEYIENNDAYQNKEKLIYEAIKIKVDVVEKDEKEKDLRQILNFGHTIGHALEVLSNGELYHGEAVAIGMTYFSSKEVKERLIKVLKKYDLPYEANYNIIDIVDKIKSDKKKQDDENINIIYVPEIGKYEIRKVSFDELHKLLGGQR
ncbi:MAG: 3-dehydroquinate synthase [Bacilli bacterium]|nr:3-dehydroquinate synthase [Bacilli bacterium]